ASTETSLNISSSIKTIGNESQAINIDTLLFYPSDYNSDIVIFDFENTGILPKSLTLRNHTTFTLNVGESKELAVEFFNPQQLNVEWILNGNTVSSEPNYTFNAITKGEFNLSLKAYDPNFPSKVFTKHWQVNVTSSEAQLLFPQGHPLYNNDITRFAIDSIGNYFWGIDKYKKAIYQVNLDNVADYTEWINPAETDLNNENPMEVRLDADRNPWFLMSSGLVLEKSSGQWAKHSLTDMGITASPTQLSLINGVMHISTENGVIKTGEVWEDVPNVEVYTTYLPTYSNPGEPNTTPTRKVFAMHQTTDGNFWIGTEYGLKNLTTGDTLYPQNHGMPFNRVLSIASSGNNLYFGDAQNGLVEYNVEQNTFRLFILFDMNKEFYTDMGIRSMSTDANGNVWFVNDAGGYGYGQGLFCFNPISKTIAHYNQNVSVVKTIAFGQNNTVYARIDDRIRVLNKEYVETQGVITFSVTNNSQPITNATITINQEELATNSIGLASVTLPFASYAYTVTHPNYQTFNANISFQEETTIEVILQPSTTHNEVNFVSSIALYPNPFNESILVYNHTNATHVEISTLSGVTVLSQPLHNNIVTTSNLNSGFYIISIYLKNGEKQVFRMVKQ
ncbi:MAG TPA: T9SS type A sorting domain-containing protein, partial [Tenuifilaceae bacterium]|nr:T9SS type A sorting domain-containing protein [Tenuifilaceae bacterium]